MLALPRTIKRVVKVETTIRKVCATSGLSMDDALAMTIRHAHTIIQPNLHSPFRTTERQGMTMIMTEMPALPAILEVKGRAEVNALALARALPRRRRQKETKNVDDQKEKAKATSEHYPILVRSETIDLYLLILENSDCQVEIEYANFT